MWKSSKQVPNYPTTAETSIVIIDFKGSSVNSALIMLLFLTVTLHESGIRKAVFGPWLNNTEVYLTPFSTQNQTNVITKGSSQNVTVIFKWS